MSRTPKKRRSADWTAIVPVPNKLPKDKHNDECSAGCKLWYNALVPEDEERSARREPGDHRRTKFDEYRQFASATKDLLLFGGGSMHGFWCCPVKHDRRLICR